MSNLRVAWAVGMLALTLTATILVAGSGPAQARDRGTTYPWHTNIVATTFWVGEIFDPDADDGSQMLSAYDDHWYRNYGGCDGRWVSGTCRTERRVASNGFFPRQMTPKQNPFYLDLPFDDLNDPIARATRSKVVPWMRSRAWRAVARSGGSVMKNRWVKITRRGRTCYGQIQDAGPGHYHDAKYVFGSDNRRPSSKRYNNAGMDVSPALNGCLKFSSLNGQGDRISWRFVDAVDVPPGPWRRIVTRR